MRDEATRDTRQDDARRDDARRDDARRDEATRDTRQDDARRDDARRDDARQDDARQDDATQDTAPPRQLIVDAANVIGSVPDQWWRDRAGAAERLRDALVPVATAGLPGLAPPLEVVLVVEGAARGVASVAGVRVVAAAGSGDDTIVALVRGADQPWHCTVVTADRGLRDRIRDAGADVRGPSAVPRRPRLSG